MWRNTRGLSDSCEMLYYFVFQFQFFRNPLQQTDASCYVTKDSQLLGKSTEKCLFISVPCNKLFSIIGTEVIIQGQPEKQSSVKFSFPESLKNICFCIEVITTIQNWNWRTYKVFDFELKNIRQVRFWIYQKQRAVENVAKTSPDFFHYVNTELSTKNWERRWNRSSLFKLQRRSTLPTET